jgi:hypothetical protein
MTTLLTDFGNSALPKDGYLDDVLREVPNLTAWARAQAGEVTIANTDRIFTFNDKITAGQFTFTQSTDANRPTLLGNQINGYSAANFDGTNDFLVWSLPLPDTTQAFSIAALFRQDATQDFGAITSRFTSGTNKAMSMICTPTGLELQHGDYTSDTTRPGVIAAKHVKGQWTLAILSSDTRVVRGRVNGVDYDPVATNNPSNTNFFALGSANSGGASFPFKGQIAGFKFFNIDILAPTGIDILSALERYAVETYALPFRGAY